MLLAIKKLPRWFRRLINFFQNKEGKVPPELEGAIKATSSTEELTSLLFSTDFTLNEAMVKAFDKRFEELEKVNK